MTTRCFLCRAKLGKVGPVRDDEAPARLRDLVIVRYFIFGSVAALTQLAALAAFVELGRFEAPVSSTLAFAIAVVVNYILQRNFTFRSEGRREVEFPKFVLISIGGLLLNYIIMSVLVYYIYYIISQIISLFVVFIYNFEANRRFVF